MFFENCSTFVKSRSNFTRDGDTIIKEERAVSDERRSSYYERLGVHRASKPEEIRLAWKKFSRLYHPDAYATKSAKLRANAEQHFIALSEAWSVLRDPKLRHQPR